MRTGIRFSGFEFRSWDEAHSSTKHKQLLCDHCWEAAGWPSSLVTSLTSESVLPPARLQSCVSLLCPHRKPLLACSDVFRLCWWWLSAHVLLSLKLVTLPLFMEYQWALQSFPAFFPGYMKEWMDFLVCWQRIGEVFDPAMKKSLWLFTQGHERQRKLQKVIQTCGHRECGQLGRTRLVPGALTCTNSASWCQADGRNADGLSVTCKDWNQTLLCKSPNVFCFPSFP